MSATAFVPGDFTLRGEDDFLRVDSLCRDLLHDFHSTLVSSGVLLPRATSLARSADLFVRDFVVDHLKENPFMIDETTVIRFAATWYVTSTMEPNRTELERHLMGIEEFARYLHRDGFMESGRLERIVAATRDLDYYGSRIDSYWQLDAQSYAGWVQEPLERRRQGS